MNHSLLRFLAGLAIVVTLAFSSNPPNGRTGAPGESLCSGCHGGGAQSGNVMINGVPSTITPGQTYTLTVMSTTTSSSNLAGFQMVGLHDDGNINAGTMTNPSGGSTVTVVANGRSYHEHQPAAGFGGGSTVSWTVDWTAPTSGPNGNIIFYTASILANGNGQSSGDGQVTTFTSGTFMAQPPLIAEITNSTPTSCSDGSDGTATASASGGNPGYSYLWSNGETTSTAMLLQAGNQSVTVTDAIAQTATASIEITEPDTIGMNLSIVNHVSCNGLADGQASTAPEGGTSPYTILWSTGATTNTTSNLAAGMYSVTITDANNCTENGSVQINEPDLLEIELLIRSNVTCNGFNDGSATVAGSGGTPSYNYSWSTGATGPTANNLIPGINSVTVTDVNGCLNTREIIIVEPDVLTITLVNQVNTTCFGAGVDGSATMLAEGGTGAYTYTWSDGQMGPTASNLAPDTYSCLVTDINNCEAIRTVTILAPELITDLIFTVQQISTPGANDGSISVIPVGGTPPYSYLWSTGSVDSAISNLPPDIYTIEVGDANGCSLSTSITIFEPGGCDLTVDIIVLESLVCENDSTGVLTISTNSTAISSILWSRGAITDTISGLPSGNYSVTVTDTANCEAMASIILSGNDTEIPGYKLDTLCLFIGADGTATLDSATFYENLEDNCDEHPTAIFSELIVDCDDIGIFSMDFSLSDVSGNIGSVSLNLIVVDTMPPTITCGADITVNTCDTIFYSMPTAMDNCDSFTIELVAGIGSGNSFPVGTTTETYRAKDQGGNQSTCSFTVTVISDLDVNTSVTETLCFDTNDGMAIVSGIGGTPPLSFSIVPNADITMLSQGTYFLTLMDAANCAVLDTFTITGPEAIELDSILVTNASASGIDGSIEIDVIGGTTPYEFFWYRDTMPYSTEEDIFNLFSGYYSLVITDDNGCEMRFDSILVEQMLANTQPEELANQFKIFSVDKQIHIIPISYDGLYNLKLYDGTGQLVSIANGQAGELAINMTNTSSGFYIISVYIEKTRPIIKRLIVH